MKRRRAVGAEVPADVMDEGVHFRVWAPARQRVAVVIDGRDLPLRREDNGYFSELVPGARAGTLYTFRLDDGEKTFPDPASRFQPVGPHGPSQVWTAVAKPPLSTPAAKLPLRCGERQLRCRSPEGHVIYEMHMGTFTREGTYAAAIEHLPALAELGITLLEVMPLHEFPGRFGWGYDGVDLFAPSHLYGTPDDLRRFVGAAHGLGLGVILDVVYNHFGPDGCYLREFTPEYFTDRHTTDWGAAVNFASEGVRTFVCENAAYWIDEFQFDGLRLDATQSIFDDSPRHVIADLTAAARAAAPDRSLFLCAENEPQDTRLLHEYGLDAMWNDDWHHSAMVAAGRPREAYYTDYRGTAQEFVSMARLGFLYQGQWYSWQKNNRGTPSHDIAPERLICFLQNHDQVANTQSGDRTLHAPLTALLLLQPQTPMLFQGEEFGAPMPFRYFADHEPELAKLVRNGRAEFMEQFPSIDIGALPVPDDPATFDQCRLPDDREPLALYRDLLRLRREQPFHARMEGAVLSERCLALRWLANPDRLLIVNLGDELVIDPVDEPLLAGSWRPLWSTDPITLWRIPRRSAALFIA